MEEVEERKEEVKAEAPAPAAAPTPAPEEKSGQEFKLPPPNAYPTPAPAPAPTRTAPAEYTAAWESVHAALQADRYRIVAKLDNPDAPAPAGAKNFGTFTYGKSRAMKDNKQELFTKTGAFIGFTKEEITSELPGMAQRDNDKRYGHYVCPISAEKHYILIDDCTTQEKQQLADNYHAALVLTSSPGNQQRIIMVEAHKDPEIARLAANKLSEHLNRKCGDPAVKNGQQDWRIPYFHNHKPKRIQDDGTSPRAELISAQGGTCERAQAIYNRYAMELEQKQGQRNRTEQVQNRTEPNRTAPQPQPQPAAPASTSEWAKCGVLYKDVYVAAVKQIAHGYARRGLELPAGHKLDYVVAVRLAVIGYGRQEIEKAIHDGAPIAEREKIRTAQGESPDMSKDWNAYAAAKAGEAFAAQGQAQVSKYADKAKTWQREEARDAATIQRAYIKAGIEIPAEHRKQQSQQQGQGQSQGMEM